MPDYDENEIVYSDALKKLNVEKVFIERTNQDTVENLQLTKALEYLRAEDVLVVRAFAEVARSVTELLDIVNDLAQKHVGFISLKENIDTSLPNGSDVLNVFVAMAKFDYDIKRTHQRKGIELAKLEGKYKGRKAVEVDEEKFELLYNAWQTGKSTPKIMMNELKLKPATFWRRVKLYREKHGITEDTTSRKRSNETMNLPNR